MEKGAALLILPHEWKPSMNHSNMHRARYVVGEFDRVDIVTTAKMYAGSSHAGLLKKALVGPVDIVRDGVVMLTEGNVRHFMVRFPRRPPSLDYLLRDFWTYARMRGRLEDRYDLCVLGGPQGAYVGLRLKRLGRVRVLLYEDWDYQPSVYPENAFWRYSMRYREALCLRGADGVVSASSLLCELRRRQGAERVMHLPNGVDYPLFAKAQQKIPHPPTLVYMGSLKEEWGVDLALEALGVVRKEIPEIQFLVIGEGPHEARLREMVTELGLVSNVHFCGRHDYEELPAFLARADIGVAAFRDTVFRKYACPLKVIEYMAAGLPVVGTNVGETQIMIERARAGEVVQPTVRAIAQCLLSLLSDRNKYEAYSANAVTFAREHDWKELFARWMAFVRQLPSACVSGSQ